VAKVAPCIVAPTRSMTTKWGYTMTIFSMPRDASRSPNNSSKHKSSVRPEGSRAEYPSIIAKRYCLCSIDLAYKMLGYRCRLHVVRSEGGPEWRRSRSLDFCWNAFR